MCSYVHTYVWRRGKREKEREKAKEERFGIETLGFHDYGDQEVTRYAISVSRTTRKLVLQLCSVQLEDLRSRNTHI